MSLHSNADGYAKGNVILEAQHSAMESSSNLGTLAFNYAMELNKSLFELGQKQMMQFANLQQHLAYCRTPEEFLNAQAEMVEKTTQCCKEGLDRIASASSDMALEAGEALKEGQAAARNMTDKNRKDDGTKASGTGRTN